MSSTATTTTTVYVPYHVGGASATVSKYGRYAVPYYRVASTPDGATYAMTTDGRSAAVAPCATPGGPLSNPVLIPREASARHGVRLSIDGASVTCQTMTATGRVGSAHGKVHPMPANEDCPFPPLREIFDGDAQGRQWITIDATLLHRLAAAIGDGTVSLGFRTEDDGRINRNSPIYAVGHKDVGSTASVHGIGIMMPKGSMDWTHDGLSDAYRDAVAKALPAMH